MLFLGDLFYTSKSERERFNVNVKSSSSVYTFKSTVRLKSVSGSGTSTVYAGGGKRQGGSNSSGWLKDVQYSIPFYGPCQASCDAFATGDILNGVGYFGTAVFEVFTLGAGTEISRGTEVINTSLKGLKTWVNGGKSFVQYKSTYWATKTKPVYQPIRMANGKVFKVYEELHHAYIPQRAKWAPNWLKNNSLNLKPLNSIQHGIRDPYRFQFFPEEIKNAIRNGETFGY